MKRVLFFVMIALVLGCGGGGLIDPPFSLQSYNGTYQGSWHNDTYNTTGPANIVITANDTTHTGTFHMDFDGNVLGQGDPPADDFNVTYDDTGLSFTGTSNAFGALSFHVGQDGAFTGTGLNPTASVSRVDFNGSISQTTIQLNYSVTFTAGGGATGTVTLPRQ